MNIKLEVGKRYVMRNGEIIGPLRENEYNWFYPFTDEDESWQEDGICRYTHTSWERCEPSPYDIVAEYKE